MGQDLWHALMRLKPGLNLKRKLVHVPRGCSKILYNHLFLLIVGDTDKLFGDTHPCVGKCRINWTVPFYNFALSKLLFKHDQVFFNRVLLFHPVKRTPLNEVKTPMQFVRGLEMILLAEANDSRRHKTVAKAAIERTISLCTNVDCWWDKWQAAESRLFSWGWRNQAIRKRQWWRTSSNSEAKTDGKPSGQIHLLHVVAPTVSFSWKGQHSPSEMWTCANFPFAKNPKQSIVTMPILWHGKCCWTIPAL